MVKKRRGKDIQALAHAVKLDGRGHGIGYATGEGFLVVDRRTGLPKVGTGRKRLQVHKRGGIEEIPLVGDIGKPAVLSL
jgi:hypothetical protein